MRRAFNLLLKARMAEERLVLPNQKREMRDIRDFISETAKYEFRERTLLGHVSGR